MNTPPLMTGIVALVRRGWTPVLRMYGALEPWFNKTWRLDRGQRALDARMGIPRAMKAGNGASPLRTAVRSRAFAYGRKWSMSGYNVCRSTPTRGWRRGFGRPPRRTPDAF